MSDQRFLIVRLGSLGDVIHAIPAVAALKHRLSGAQRSTGSWIHATPIWSGWSTVVDRVIPFDPRRGLCVALLRRRVRRQLRRAASTTRSIDLQGLLKSAVLARAAGARRTIGFARGAPARAAGADSSTRRPHDSGRRHARHSEGLGADAGRRRGRLDDRVSARRSAVERGGRRRCAGRLERLRADQSGRRVAEQAMAAGALRRAGRGDSRAPRSAVAGAVGAGRGGVPRRRSSPPSRGAAEPAPPTTHHRHRGDREGCEPHGVRRHRPAAHCRAPSARRSSRCSVRRAPSATVHGRRPTSRSRAFDQCVCHYERRCRRAQPCIDDISVDEVMAAVERRVAAR